MSERRRLALRLGSGRERHSVRSRRPSRLGRQGRRGRPRTSRWGPAGAPRWGRWLACGPVSATRVVTRGAGPAQHVLRKFVLQRFYGGGLFGGQGFDICLRSRVSCWGDGGYKINVYNIGTTCSAESQIIDWRTYGSPIDRVSMVCMGDTLCDASRQTKPWGESNPGYPFVVRHRVVYKNGKRIDYCVAISRVAVPAHA